MADRQTLVAKVEARTGGAQKVSGVASIGTFADQQLQVYNASAVERGDTRTVELTITGDGGDEYSLGSDWSDEYSRVLEVWFWDSNDTDDHPRILSNDEWEVEIRLPASAASQIRFLTVSPSSSDRVVVVHTALHTMTDSATTLDTWDEEAFADLVAARVLEAAATALLALIPQGADTDALLGSPNAERAREYRESARLLQRRYDRHFGISEGGDTSSAFIAIEDADKAPGVNYYRHTHRRRRRGY